MFGAKPIVQIMTRPSAPSTRVGAMKERITGASCRIDPTTRQAHRKNPGNWRRKEGHVRPKEPDCPEGLEPVNILPARTLIGDLSHAVPEPLRGLVTAIGACNMPVDSAEYVASCGSYTPEHEVPFPRSSPPSASSPDAAPIPTCSSQTGFVEGPPSRSLRHGYSLPRCGSANLRRKASKPPAFLSCSKLVVGKSVEAVLPVT